MHSPPTALPLSFTVNTTNSKDAFRMKSISQSKQCILITHSLHCQINDCGTYTLDTVIVINNSTWLCESAIKNKSFPDVLGIGMIVTKLV